MERQRELPESIALSLSGGGYRAAAFHLGVLAYLSRVKLLDRVQMLSTVSGGTFTGAKYTLCCLDKQPLPEFFIDYYAELRDSRIFPQTLELLGSSESLLNDSGRKNIITCAAESYCRTMFSAPDGSGPRPFDAILTGDTAPLTEITFNATDFRTGLAFRFQKSQSGIIGNFKDRVPRQEAGQLRLGDIVAASSCFPGGFEPIEFPDDFAWPEAVPSAIREEFASPSPLMDGGVYDNQGLESLLLAEDRIGDADVVIISDTDRNEKELYRSPDPIQEIVEDEEHRVSPVFRWLFDWNPTLGVLDWLSWLLVWLSGLAAVSLAVSLIVQLWHFSIGPQATWDLVVTLVSILATGGGWLLLWLLRATVRNKLLTKIPQLQSDGWKFLRRVRLAKLVDMCLARVSSLLALTSDVFMKRIRSSGFRRAFEEPANQGRLIANLIYSLKTDEHWALADPSSDRRMLPGLTDALIREIATLESPSTALNHAADTAAAVPTLLWFQHDQQQPALVAAGQFTTCANLLKFLARTREFDSESSTFVDDHVQAMWEGLREDWRQFQADPQHLVREYFAPAKAARGSSPT